MLSDYLYNVWFISLLRVGNLVMSPIHKAIATTEQWVKWEELWKKYDLINEKIALKFGEKFEKNELSFEKVKKGGVKLEEILNTEEIIEFNALVAELNAVAIQVITLQQQVISNSKDVSEVIKRIESHPSNWLIPSEFILKELLNKKTITQDQYNKTFKILEVIRQVSMQNPIKESDNVSSFDELRYTENIESRELIVAFLKEKWTSVPLILDKIFGWYVDNFSEIKCILNNSNELIIYWKYNWVVINVVLDFYGNNIVLDYLHKEPSSQAYASEMLLNILDLGIFLGFDKLELCTASWINSYGKFVWYKYFPMLGMELDEREQMKLYNRIQYSRDFSNPDSDYVRECEAIIKSLVVTFPNRYKIENNKLICIIGDNEGVIFLQDLMSLPPKWEKWDWSLYRWSGNVWIGEKWWIGDSYMDDMSGYAFSAEWYYNTTSNSKQIPIVKAFISNKIAPLDIKQASPEVQRVYKGSLFLSDFAPRDDGKSWRSMLLTSENELTIMWSAIISAHNEPWNAKSSFAVRKAKSAILSRSWFSFAEIKVLFDNSVCWDEIKKEWIHREIEGFDNLYSNLSSETRIWWLQKMLKESIALKDVELQSLVFLKLLEQTDFVSWGEISHTLYDKMLWKLNAEDSLFYRELFLVWFVVFDWFTNLEIINWDGVYSWIRFYDDTWNNIELYLTQFTTDIYQITDISVVWSDIDLIRLKELVFNFNSRYENGIQPNIYDLMQIDIDIFLDWTWYNHDDVVQINFVDNESKDVEFIVKDALSGNNIKILTVAKWLIEEYLRWSILSTDKIEKSNTWNEYLQEFPDLVLYDDILIRKVVLDPNRSKESDYFQYSTEWLYNAINILYKKMYYCNTTSSGKEKYKFLNDRLKLLEKTVLHNRLVLNIQQMKYANSSKQLKPITIDGLSNIEGLSEILWIEVNEWYKYDLVLEKHLLYKVKFWSYQLTSENNLFILTRLKHINQKLATFSTKWQLTKKHPNWYSKSYLEDIVSNEKNLWEFKQFLLESKDAVALLCNLDLLVDVWILSLNEIPEYTAFKLTFASFDVIDAIVTLSNKARKKTTGSSVAKEKLASLKKYFPIEYLMKKIDFDNSPNIWNRLFISLYYSEKLSENIDFNFSELNIILDDSWVEQSRKTISVCGSGENIFMLSLQTGNIISLKDFHGNVIWLVKTTHSSPDARDEWPKYTVVFKDNYLLPDGQIIYKNAFYTFGGESMLMLKWNSKKQSTFVNLKFLRAQQQDMTDVYFKYFEDNESNMTGGSFQFNNEWKLLNNK